MYDEIAAAASFLTRLVAKNECLQPDKGQRFEEELINVLTDKFRNHWFPERPARGQAYRCLRLNQATRRDSVIEAVCNNIGIRYTELVLPLEITIWIDPYEVTCRFGEHKGSYCVIADFRDGNKENYVDQINVDELEQKSVERAKQASFEMANSRKRKQQRSAYLKNGYSSMTNGLYSSIDYSNGLQTAPTTSAGYYGQQQHHYYGGNGVYSSSGSPKGFGGGGGWNSGLQVTTPSSNMYMSSNGYSMSPTSRMSRGGMANGWTTGTAANGRSWAGHRNFINTACTVSKHIN